MGFSFLKGQEWVLSFTRPQNVCQQVSQVFFKAKVATGLCFISNYFMHILIQERHQNFNKAVHFRQLTHPSPRLNNSQGFWLDFVI